ncbi:MAG TPA: hypothetical protein VL947_09800, partial [Cytophagales bacterium]|nr:hypothetical protein [Cytophagales bacterium]
MPKSNLIIWTSLWLVLHCAWAQNSDTIYIQQDPVIIKKQVIVHVSETKMPPTSTWFMALEGAMGKYTHIKGTDSLSISTQTVISPNVQVGYRYRKASFSIGLGKSNASAKIEHKQSVLKTIQVQPETIHLLGSYEMSGQTYYFYDTIPAQYESRRRDSTVNLSRKISYWSIPVKVGYQISFKKLYLLPQVG